MTRSRPRTDSLLGRNGACHRRSLSTAPTLLLSIRLIGQLVRPKLCHLCRREDPEELTRRNALATSRGFSLFHDVPRRGDGPEIDLSGSCRAALPTDDHGGSCALGVVGHPVGLAQPDHALPRGQHLTELPAELAKLAPGAARGSPRGGRRDAPPHIPGPAPGMAGVPAIPEAQPGCGAASARVDTAEPGVRLGAGQETCELAISRTHYRTMPDMTECLIWPAQTRLNSTHWYRTLTVVLGR